MAANVNQSQSDIVELIETIRTTADMNPFVARISKKAQNDCVHWSVRDGNAMHGRWAERYPPFFERAFNIMGGVLPITTVLRVDFENYLQKPIRVLYELSPPLQTLAPFRYLR